MSCGNTIGPRPDIVTAIPKAFVRLSLKYVLTARGKEEEHNPSPIADPTLYVHMKCVRLFPHAVQIIPKANIELPIIDT